ncbi:cactin [Nicotiana attenuata]|uniref:Splicing factor Cactin n=1 Tax=Nicotiana attenuata TaxID=49451 RepID=A0A314KNM1_NICAT|nr:cactin [Nicotiana attenuata]
MEELQEDIKLRLDMDRTTKTRVRYWETLYIVCNWELAEARKRDAIVRTQVRGEELPPEERGLHSSIEGDVKAYLEGKSYDESEAMQLQIESQMKSGKLVVLYWEAVLKRLQVARAMYQELILNEESKEDEDEGEEEDEEAGSYSPVLMRGDEKDEGIDPEEDIVILERNKRMAVMEGRHVQDKVSLSTALEESFEMKASKAMGEMEEGDAVFGSNDEVNLDSGWNNYNQAYCDHDIPPPKLVQGYMFNIFYPDLVDKSKAPTYFIDKDGDSVDTCIIKFYAGPPYEDIAFRIVNTEWEYSHKKDSNAFLTMEFCMYLLTSNVIAIAANGTGERALCLTMDFKEAENVLPKFRFSCYLVLLILLFLVIVT